jgi:hypothetical protein
LSRVVVGMVTSNEIIVGLIERHVLQPGEQTVRVKDWPDGLALATSRRHFVAGSEAAQWLVSREAWVADVVVATRDDLLVEGESERFGFLIPTDGAALYLNDHGVLGALGNRLGEGMDPAAYAQLLVAFDAYRSASRAVLTERDGLRTVFGQPDLPDVEPLRLRRSPDGVALRFCSYAAYARPGGVRMVDLLEWVVDVPSGGPARWRSAQTVTALQLRPHATRGDAGSAESVPGPPGSANRPARPRANPREPRPGTLRHGPAAPGSPPGSG